MSGNDERIRERAYELWEQAGRPDDRSLEFWFTARREVEDEATAGIVGHHIVEPGVLDEDPAALTFPSAVESPVDLTK